jgi:hypothetical protein
MTGHLLGSGGCAQRRVPFRILVKLLYFERFNIWFGPAHDHWLEYLLKLSHVRADIEAAKGDERGG